MSDAPQGEGWWQASDGKWYGPEHRPSLPPEPPPPTGPETPTGRETIVAGAAPSPGSSGGSPQPPRAGPPPPGPGGPGGAGTPGGGGKGKIVAAIVVAVALVAGAFVVITQLLGDEAGASVLLEPIGAPGPDPFSGSVAPQPAGSLLAYAQHGVPTVDDDEPGDPQEIKRRGRYRAMDGAVPGLYGGTLDSGSCDVDQLVAFLSSETEKATAWAEVLKIDVADIPAYLNGLTPVNLGADTRVINHGFAAGRATPRESVLQRGTAVLVDAQGVPRVSCYCGNPLLEPTVAAEEAYTGDRWSAFEPEEVLVVEEAPQEVAVFDLVDVESGDLFGRPAGTRGEADGPPVSRPAERDRVVDGPIEFNRTYEDRFEDERREARYTFDAPDSAIMTLTVTNRSTSVQRVVATLESQGRSFARVAVRPGATEVAEITLDHEGSAPFELTVTEGPAVFEFEVALAIQDDAGQGGDAGDDFASGFEVEAGEQVDGLLAGEDRIDVFLVDLQGGSDLLFEAAVARESAQRAVFMLRLDGQQLHRVALNPAASESASLLLSGDDAGVLEVIVTEGPALYSFTVDFVEQADGGQPGDAGGSLADARVVPTGQELQGEVGERDRSDFYLFDAPGSNVVVQFTSDATASARIVITVSDPSGRQVARIVVQPGATESEAFTAEPGGRYRMEVTEGRARYMFSIRSG